MLIKCTSNASRFVVAVLLFEIVLTALNGLGSEVAIADFADLY